MRWTSFAIREIAEFWPLIRCHVEEDVMDLIGYAVIELFLAIVSISFLLRIITVFVKNTSVVMLVDCLATIYKKQNDAFCQKIKWWEFWFFALSRSQWIPSGG